MTSTRGTKRKPLPASLLEGLAKIGYIEMPVTENGHPVFRHPKHSHLIVVAITSNFPGTTEVVARWFGVPSRYIEIEKLLRVLREQTREVSVHQKNANRETDNEISAERNYS